MKFEKIFQDALMDERQSDVAHDFNISARAVVTEAWRGRFSIPSQSLDINIVGHVSNRACLKVLEVLSIMPESLCLDMIPRLDIWPASFKSSPPAEHSVALFFFSGGRDEEVFDSLLTYAIYTDFAFKAMIGEAELLVFTSLQLPEKLHRFQGKHYFWGAFKGQQAAAFNQTDHHVHIQTPRTRHSLSPNSGNYRRFDGTGSPITVPSKYSPSSHGTKADKRGRRLDGAWEHANPLDVLRQKAECRYCGFVSSHGGISRLKAHLGGGHPRIRLPGCSKVSPEVKKVMADWFNEWVKNTKALWTKEIRAEIAAHVEKRGRRHDVVGEHAKPLDVAQQETDSKYFGFISSRAEISHHKAHLGRGDPKMHLEAWSKVSPVIKGDISETVKISMASLSPEIKGASRMKKSQAASLQAERRGRPLDDAWEHAKPLDEARQKARCNYCGFVSSYGGISRLKAHLGGGSPEMKLQGCPQVSLEVKRLMEEWYNEWTQNSMATWTRKSNAPAKPSKRGRPHDDMWEHAIPLDEMGQATKCKYCGFVSKRGGIARLKAHLGGGDLTMQLESCPNVSPEVRSLMTEEMKRYRKKSKGVPMQTAGMLQETQRTSSESLWFEKRHHILQETLDEITNTSIKQRLQKLIEAKNHNLQEMQYEIQSLESQLASMP